MFLLKVVCLFFIFFVGLRHEIGGDWEAYLIIKEGVQSLPEVWQSLFFIDPLYGLLNYIAPVSEEGIYVVNMVCATIFMFGIYHICSKNENPFFSLLIAVPYLIFVVSMGYTRQAAALGFVMVGISLLLKNRVRSYIICILLASMFHNSAVIMLSMLLVVDIKYKKRILFIILFIVLVFAYFFQNMILGKMTSYSSNEEVNSSGGIFRHFFNIFSAFVFFRYRSFFKENYSKYYNVLLFLSIASVLAFFGNFYLTTLSDRLGLYFSVLQLFIFPLFLKVIVNRDHKLFIFFIGLIYFIFLLFWFNFSFYAESFWKNYQNYLFL